MNTITHTQRYYPHELQTRIHAVKLYRNPEYSAAFVCRRYHISKSSLMRWNKRYDGTPESLMDKSHRPKTPHPNAHTEEELTWIKNLHRRNPKISICEMYGKLRTQKGYSRHPGSLYRVYQRLGYSSKAPSTKKKSRRGKYDTPSKLGVKWQMDVKHVPRACYAGDDGQGPEFTNTRPTKRKHAFDILCEQLGITHKLIRPLTPWHNGKVERSHRNDQERFYNHISFYDYEDLKLQMKRYLYRSNRIPMAVLDWLSPIEKRRELMAIFKPDKFNRIKLDQTK